MHQRAGEAAGTVHLETSAFACAAFGCRVATPPPLELKVDSAASKLAFSSIHAIMVQSGAEWCNTSPPLPSPETSMEKIRFTISADPDVHAAFSEMAEQAGQSLSRVVGDWLRDTTAASRLVTDQMSRLRRSPESALRVLQAVQDRDREETAALIKGISSGTLMIDGAGAQVMRGARTRAQARENPIPPSSNTGGKGRKEPLKARRT